MSVATGSRRAAPKGRQAPSGRIIPSPVARKGQRVTGSKDKRQEQLISDEILHDAESYFLKQSADGDYPSCNTEAQVHWLKNRLTLVNKQRQTQHIAALSNAYAMYAKMRSDPGFRESILTAAELAGKKRGNEKQDLRTIVELHMAYETGENEQGSKNAKTLYSRDAAAIRGLISRNVLPSQVIELGRAKGEGLDAWSRAGEKRPYRKPQGATNANQEHKNNSASISSGNDQFNANTSTEMQTVTLQYKLKVSSKAKNIVRWDKILADGSKRFSMEAVAPPELSMLIESFYAMLEEKFPDCSIDFGGPNKF